jgi:putative hydrolase of the HAD superfamily
MDQITNGQESPMDSDPGDTDVQAVVFDFGGVYTASPFSAAAEVGEAAGLDPMVAITLLFGSYDHDTDHPWHRAERGQLDLQACRDEILAMSMDQTGVALDMWEVFGALGKSMSGVRQQVVDHTLRIRKSGVRTGLLTNNVLEAREFWRTMIPLDEMFDDVVDSCEVGLRKPDARIFELSMQRLGVTDPGAVVFLDDWPGNVAAARRFGMTGIVVDDDPADALAALDVVLGW